MNCLAAKAKKKQKVVKVKKCKNWAAPVILVIVVIVIIAAAVMMSSPAGMFTSAGDWEGIVVDGQETNDMNVFTMGMSPNTPDAMELSNQFATGATEPAEEITFEEPEPFEEMMPEDLI